MEKKAVSIIMLTLLSFSVFAFALGTQRARAWTGTILIRADGSIYPSDAPVERNGNLYILTGNINSNAHGIIIERSNMTLDGLGNIVQGAGEWPSKGINITGSGNKVTNIRVSGFYYGIYLHQASNIGIVGNNITDNWYGLWLSRNGYVSGNSITDNSIGLYLGIGTKNNTIDKNVIGQNDYGIWLEDAFSSLLVNNVISSNDYGMFLYPRRSLNNTIYLNNFHNSLNRTFIFAGYNHVGMWSSRSPIEYAYEGSTYTSYLGNYWSNYGGSDTDGNGIGEIAYNISSYYEDTDNYPLMAPVENYEILTPLISDCFDYPVGIPRNQNGAGYVTQPNDGDGYYNAQDFGVWNEDYNAYHLGEDWNGEDGGDTDFGDPVYATSNGKVVYAKDAGVGWGNIIIISHTLPEGSHVQSMYAHLRYGSLLVNEGDNIRIGTKIAEIGKGFNDEEYFAHLHFEVRFPDCDRWGQPGPGYRLGSTGWADPSEFIDTHRQLCLVRADGKLFNVGFWSNSSISNVVINSNTKALIFDIEGSDGTTGFCNVTIPKQLLRADSPLNWIVIINNDPVMPKVSEDPNYTYLYFTYTHSTKRVQIIGTQVVPEFPFTRILPLLVILSMFAFVFSNRRRKPMT